MENRKLAEALRCSSGVHKEGPSCEECPFFAKADPPETMKDRYPEELLYLCDMDRIALEAADALENTVADVAPVRPELRKAVGLLNVNYEKGLRNPVICDPLAWALFQTWKAMNGGQ